jgi:hypothetical protein
MIISGLKMQPTTGYTRPGEFSKKQIAMLIAFKTDPYVK